jgi:Predicted oxidoreductases of the aldo/keto reductase family
VSLTGCKQASEKAFEDDYRKQVEPPKGKMTYRTTPTTKDKVSLLGYGMMRLPTIDESGKKDGEKVQIDQEQVNRLVDYALEHGVNYFDTSPVYCQGQSEHATGIALRRHPRNSFYVATKLSNFDDRIKSKAASIEMFNNSLKELQVDYIDYYLLHAVGGGGMENFSSRYLDNGILDWLLEQRKNGKIRNLGFSYHGDIEVFDWLLENNDKYHWDFVQIQLNYLDWNYANEMNPDNTDASYLYDELQKRGIPAVIMEPLLGGRLAKLPQYIAKQLKTRDPERSVASWAFRYAGTPKGVLTVLSGMTYMEHLKDNLLSYCPLKPLTNEENEFLYKVAKDIAGFETIPCNDCKYCMPCPYGVDIPAIFVHYNKCKNDGTLPRDVKDEKFARYRRQYLIGLDRSVPKLRQASHCIQCGQCVPHCPQKIRIPVELEKIDQFVESLKQGTFGKENEDEKA